MHTSCVQMHNVQRAEEARNEGVENVYAYECVEDVYVYECVEDICPRHSLVQEAGGECLQLGSGGRRRMPPGYSTRMYMYMCVCVYVYVQNVCIIFMCGCVCVGAYVWVRMCGCVCVGAYVWVRMCGCVYVDRGHTHRTNGFRLAFDTQTCCRRGVQVDFAQLRIELCKDFASGAVHDIELGYLSERQIRRQRCNI